MPQAQQLRVRVRREDCLIVVEVSGELHAVTATELTTMLEPVVAQVQGDLILDLSEVAFADSAALGALVRLHDDCVRRGCHLRLVITSSVLLRILEVTGLDLVLDVYGDPAAAGEAARDQP